MFWRRKDPPPLDRARSMAGIPIRHSDMDTKRLEGGGMLVTARFPRGAGFLSRFSPPVLEDRVELDELGAFVMEKIDGERTVTDIVEVFREQYALNRREAQLSTVAFIRSLVRRRLVSIAIT